MDGDINRVDGGRGMMTPELAKTPWQNTRQHDYHVRDVVRYLRGKISEGYSMLDVGEESPLTERIRQEFHGIAVSNTSGDLDTIRYVSPRVYKYVLYSHTIEHQFNPLHTLLEIRKVMTSDSVMFIILPRRGKLLWDRGHYHEIDHYRMGLLLRRAGYSIISYQKIKAWRPWRFYLTGIRPLMRLLFEYNAYYEVKLTGKNEGEPLKEGE